MQASNSKLAASLTAAQADAIRYKREAQELFESCEKKEASLKALQRISDEMESAWRERMRTSMAAQQQMSSRQADSPPGFMLSSLLKVTQALLRIHSKMASQPSA